jgi:hypothetical protein
LIRFFNLIGFLATEFYIFLTESLELIWVESFLENEICQIQINSPNSIFINILQTIVGILKNPSKYSNETSQLSCSMSLVKMMLLSHKICNPYLELLFSLLKESQFQLVKSNLVAGISDLVCKFPNSLEPWTDHLYIQLKSKNVEIRTNTLKIVTQLILKERIKTNSDQLFEIALLIVDPCEKISNTSKTFFGDLALRNSSLIIFNALPDIISKLSNYCASNFLENPRNISELKFQEIATFLFSFIERYKKNELLIENLCNCFNERNLSELRCLNLAFFLAKFKLREDCIKKIKEKFEWFTGSANETINNIKVAFELKYQDGLNENDSENLDLKDIIDFSYQPVKKIRKKNG